MNEYVDLTVRPSQLVPNLAVVAGLTWIGVFYWQVVPGITLLLLSPCLGLCLYQMVISPVYGLRIGPREWMVLSGRKNHAIPQGDIAYLRIAAQRGLSHATLILRDGREVALPLALSSDPLRLVREAIDRGVPVRLH